MHDQLSLEGLSEERPASGPAIQAKGVAWQQAPRGEWENATNRMCGMGIRLGGETQMEIGAE